MTLMRKSSVPPGKNAVNAGVDHLIHFQQRAVRDLRHPKPYGFIITNPPYGERLEEKETLPQIYQDFGESFRGLKDWSAYMITSYEDTERWFGRKADKNRKIYNGNDQDLLLPVYGAEAAKKEKRGAGCIKTGERRKSKMSRIVFATGNADKMVEIREIFKRPWHGDTFHERGRGEPGNR